MREMPGPLGGKQKGRAANPPNHAHAIRATAPGALRTPPLAAPVRARPNSHPQIAVSAEGEVLAANTLATEAVAAVVQHTRGGRTAAGGRVCVLACTCCDDGEYPAKYLELAPEGPTWTTELIQNAGEPIELMETLDCLSSRTVLKVVLFTRPDEPGWASMDATVAALREAVGEAAAVLDCGKKQCEVLPTGVNKGSGVAKLLSRLQIPPVACLCLGDAENDVEMLRLAGVGVAMGNARPAAREAADVVVGTDDEDGVAEAVHRFVLDRAS